MDSTYLNNLQTYLTNPNFRGTPGVGMMTDLNGNTGGGLGSNFFGNNSNLGFNSQTLQLALSGLGAIGNFYNAFQANKLANNQFDFTKSITEKNLTNQTKSYNTALSDRINARASSNGMSAAEVQDYLANNRL